MTGIYQRSGIHFLYPESWTLADDALDQSPRTISVQAPSGAFWSVDIHPFSVDPRDLVEQVLQAMHGEYEGIEASELNDEVGDHECVGYELFFCCMDFIVTSKIRAFRRGHATYLLTYQAEDRDFDQLSVVFDAITHSFLSEEPLGSRP